MVKAVIVAIVGFCTRFAYATIAVAVLITVAASCYTAANFAINTDINNLISKDVPWRQREITFGQRLPTNERTIVAIVDAPTPELATLARAALVDELSADKTLFETILQRDAALVRSGLLFQSTDEVASLTKQLAEGGTTMLRVPQTDPSLRGLARMIQLVLAGIRDGESGPREEQRVTFDKVAKPFDKAAAAVEKVMNGERATFSWLELMTGKPSTPSELRKIIEIKPKLNFDVLEPGKEATDAIRAAAAKLDLASRFQARVRLTGQVAVENEEFGTLKDGAAVNAAITLALVLFILWLALHSFRLILAVTISLFMGLSVTAMVGLMLVGALNPISIAFAVLFVGLGVDFGIQFSVRYRQERFKEPDLRTALSMAGARAGVPLTLAAAAVAAGFLSFLPTTYRGVSELGEIAGAGMIIAYITSITVLPALIFVLRPPGEAEGLGFTWLAPVDNFLEKRRIPIVVGTLGTAIAGLPLLYFLQFDLNPMHLRSTKVESVATYLEIQRDPTVGANAIHLLAPSLDKAKEIARRLKALPEVDQVVTLADLIPTDQPAKLALIRAVAPTLDRLVWNAPPRKPPTDQENIAALKERIDDLNKTAEGHTGAGPDAARRLAAAMSKLAAADPQMRQRVEATFIVPLRQDLQMLHDFMRAQEITVDNLPSELRSYWINASGETRVQATPRGDPDDNENIRTFAQKVLDVEPTAVGGPVSILESGHTVVSAFIEAGLWALGSIALLLWLALRRFGDVLLTLVPLILAGALTLEIGYLIGLPLNFANIIALPLLLGVGVAFKIYYILSWRSGRTKLLQSSLTRAVIFSAATTATAFGSLWFSNHPGTSSMGKLLALSLSCTLLAAVLFQPALMGPPRTTRRT
jgi:hopanoid biosynthesis associated RND transporter like protein HpnN